MIPRRQLPSEGKHLDSTTMRSPELYIVNCMMGSCFAAFRTKKHWKALREAHDGMCGAHQPAPNLEIDSENLVMISDAVAYAKRCHAC